MTPLEKAAANLWIDPFTLMIKKMSKKEWLRLRRFRLKQFLNNAIQRAKEPVE